VDGGGAEPAGALVAFGKDALWLRPAFHDGSGDPAAAPAFLHALAGRARPVLSALALADLAQCRTRLGADRPPLGTGFFRRHRHRGDETALRCSADQADQAAWPHRPAAAAVGGANGTSDAIS